MLVWGVRFCWAWTEVSSQFLYSRPTYVQSVVCMHIHPLDTLFYVYLHMYVYVYTRTGKKAEHVIKGQGYFLRRAVPDRIIAPCSAPGRVSVRAGHSMGVQPPAAGEWLHNAAWLTLPHRAAVSFPRGWRAAAPGSVRGSAQA